MDEAPDYTNYTLEQLDDAFRHINKEKYPDIFNKLLQEIEARRHLVSEESPVQQESNEWSVAGLFRYQPPDYGDDASKTAGWGLRDVIFGLLFMSCLFGGYYLLSRSTFLNYRPWIGEPVGFVAWLAGFVLAIFFALRLCHGRPYWHIVRLKGLWPFFKECLVSFEYILAVVLLLLPIRLLLQGGFDLSTDSTRFVGTRLAPSSLLNMAILVATFTLGPIAEELFFRGFLYSALRSRLNVLVAASIQAAVFSSIHRESLFGGIAIFALGVAAAVLYERRKNLLSPILLHAIKNAMLAIPLLVLSCMNYHIPAHTWEEAKQPPSWLNRVDEVKQQDDGMKQWQYAIDQWGSKGSKQWKKEAAGFVAVCDRYPEQREACARAKLSLVMIYCYYLKDPRRAIVEADDLLKSYPDQREQCGQALSMEGWAYYDLKNFAQARRAFVRLGEEFRGQKEAVESSREGIKRVNALEKR